MGLVKPSTLPGFMELDPQSQLVFDEIKYRMERIFRLYGYYPLDTPVMEKSEILLAKGGGETEKQVYRFEKGETDITMRYDLTVPLAKYVAMNYSRLSFPFKRFQIGKVYRGEKSQRGRFREFYQCDIDVIGVDSLSIVNEAEVPSIMCSVFNEIGLHEFVIRINNRKILNGLFEIKEISEYKVEALRIIDKLEKIGLDRVVSQLIELGIKESVAQEVLDLLGCKGTNEEILFELAHLKGLNVLFDEGLRELECVIKYMKSFGTPEKNYKVDLSIARGLDYYTGTVYETTFLPKPEIGSICSGGRYDNLASYYTKATLPGVGMSIGLTRLFYILNEYGFLNENAVNVADVLVLPMTDDLFKAAEISTALRKRGIVTQLYLENKKFKNKISYADKIGVPFVIFLGEDEIKSGLVSLKDMRTGNQKSMALEDAICVLETNVSRKVTEVIKTI